MGKAAWARLTLCSDEWQLETGRSRVYERKHS